MTDVHDPHAPGDMTVLDAWRILARPVPSRRAATYVGLIAIVVLLNVSAAAALVAGLIPSPLLAMVIALVHTTFVPGLLLAFALVPPDEVDAAEWLTLGKR